MAGDARRGNRVIGAMIGGLAGLGLMVAGCVSYTNVPVPESAPAFKSANHTQSIKVVIAALNTIVTRYPPVGDGVTYAVNLPSGTTPESAQEIIESLPDGAIVPFEGMSGEVPVYHIGRIWIRASDAKVDVVFPRANIDGSVRDHNVTVWLSGGLQSWRVRRVQPWAPGTIATPEIYVPIDPEAYEAELEAQTEIEMEGEAPSSGDDGEG